eukprot:30489_1
MGVHRHEGYRGRPLMVLLVHSSVEESRVKHSVRIVKTDFFNNQKEADVSDSGCQRRQVIAQHAARIDPTIHHPDGGPTDRHVAQGRLDNQPETMPVQRYIGAILDFVFQ